MCGDFNTASRAGTRGIGAGGKNIVRTPPLHTFRGLGGAAGNQFLKLIVL